MHVVPGPAPRFMRVLDLSKSRFVRASELLECRSSVRASEEWPPWLESPSSSPEPSAAVMRLPGVPIRLSRSPVVILPAGVPLRLSRSPVVILPPSSSVSSMP